jgi:glycosyltransferase involved in cell wall biosynthesis
LIAGMMHTSDAAASSTVQEAAVCLGLVIPTLNRLESLNRLLASVFAQSIPPAVIVVVDASDPPIERFIARDSRVEIHYVRLTPPCVARQKNAGVSALPPRVTHVGFLDDDLILQAGSLERMISFVGSAGNGLAGASFNIQATPSRIPRWVAMLMAHAPLRPGTVCSSGYPGSNVAVARSRSARWLCGGATVWRRDIFEHHWFDERIEGHYLWEDVDFSFDVGRKHALAVVAGAKVLHDQENGRATTAASARQRGDREVADRFYFVRKYQSDMSLVLAVWATLGTIVRNVLRDLEGPDAHGVARAAANARALCRCLFTRLDRLAL